MRGKAHGTRESQPNSIFFVLQRRRRVLSSRNVLSINKSQTADVVKKSHVGWGPRLVGGVVAERPQVDDNVDKRFA